MATYRIWNTPAGDAQIEVRAVKPFIIYPILSLLENGQSTPIALREEIGSFRADLTAEQVALLRASPTTAGAPFLFLTVNALFKPGAPDRKWQWGIAVKQGGTKMQCLKSDGSIVPSDSNGLIRSSVRSFSDDNVSGVETWIISLT